MILQDIKPVNENVMGFVRCKKRQDRKIDQRFCMVCKDKCEEKSNLEGIRIAKNYKKILKMVESDRRLK